MNLYHAEQLLNFVKEYIVQDSMIGAIRIFVDKYDSEPAKIRLVIRNITKDEISNYHPI